MSWPHDRSSDARFDHDDRITKLRGDFTLPDADSLEDAVVSFLDEHSDELHLPNGRSTMEVVHRADTPTGGVVRLQQQVDSIPVFNSEVIVATDPDNRVRQIDLHRQALRLRIERRPFRHGPRQQHAVVLEAEVVVQVAGEMLLDAEEALVFRRCDFPLGLRGLIEVAFAFVLFECHAYLGRGPWRQPAIAAAS